MPIGSDNGSDTCGEPSQRAQSMALRNVPISASCISSPSRLFPLLARLRQSENTRRRAHGARQGSDDTPAGESRLNPHRPVVSPQQSSPNAHRTIPRVRAGKVVRGNKEGGTSRGARTIRTVTAIQGKQKRDEDSLQHRVQILERALTNMRSKVLSYARHVYRHFHD